MGGPTDIERERGVRIAHWLRSGMTPPRQTVELTKAAVARLTNISPSSIGYYVNGCYDINEDRMKYPSEEHLRRLADKLRIDFSDGLAARYWTPNTPRSVYEISCVLQAGQIVRIACNGTLIRVTDNILRRLQIEAELEEGALLNE